MMYRGNEMNRGIDLPLCYRQQEKYRRLIHHRRVDHVSKIKLWAKVMKMGTCVRQRHI